MIDALLILMGFGIVCIIDTAWRYIDYSKAEKGLEAHEHYHIGLELMIVAAILHQYIPHVPWVLLSAGGTFFLSEWLQIHWIKNNKVVPGHPFAYGTPHFIQSSIIGVILVIILAVVSILSLNTSF